MMENENGFAELRKNSISPELLGAISNILTDFKYSATILIMGGAGALLLEKSEKQFNAESIEEIKIKLLEKYSHLQTLNGFLQ